MYDTWFAAILSLTIFLLDAVTAVPDPDTVAIKFQKVARADHNEHFSVLRKRQADTITTEISNFGLLYLINVTVGTPSQEFSLQLDTGSSDLWIPSADSDICSYASYYCVYGAFNSNDSSTFQEDQDFGQFSISYVDGTAIDGIYFNDTLNIDNTKITDATMALALVASSDQGIMGVGFRENESSTSPSRPDQGLGPAFTYPTVLDNLVSQNLIKSRTYALWLDDLSDNTGTILFGGVDTEKYTGPLISLPIQNDFQSGSRTSFTVAWTNFSVNTGSTILNYAPSSPQPAILDSGTSLTYLPDNIVEQLFTGFGITTDPSIGNVVPCTQIANNYTFTYTFGGANGPSISVPLSEILFPLVDTDYQPYTGTTNPSDPQLCQFGIDNAGSGPILLGDTVLRSAYVVYDLENFQIGLAQTNFRASASEDGDQISVISGSAGIPGVTSTASAASVEQTFEGIPLGTEGGQSGTRTRTATATSDAGVDYGFGTETISRSATFVFSESGTVPPSQTVTGTATSRGGSGSMVSTSASSAATSVGATASASAGAALSVYAGATMPATLAGLALLVVAVLV